MKYLLPLFLLLTACGAAAPDGMVWCWTNLDLHQHWCRGTREACEESAEFCGHLYRCTDCVSVSVDAGD